jgi:predicted kinase
MTRRVYSALLVAARTAVRRGHSLVLDATFSRRTDRAELRAFAKRIGAAVLFVEITAPAAVRRRRLAERNHAGSVSDARLSDFAMLATRYEPPTELPAPMALQIRSRATPPATLAAALLALAEKRGLSPFSEK